MPANRTKSIKRSDSCKIFTSAIESINTLTPALTGNQPVWTDVIPTARVDLSFAVNVTPITYSDTPPPLVDCPPSEFIMFPPTGEISAPRRQPHSKKKPENHIPRPPNAFILFRSSFIKSQHVSTEVETNHSTLSKIIGLTWSNMPEEERKVWHLKAKEALDEHKRKFPKYAFRPVQTKAKGAASEKRKVREVEPKDIKRCAKIAQLLVEGKKGDELNAAVQEFDKTHVPEIITRFEAPITARAYRRSSSAPIPDTENSRASQSFLQQLVSHSPKKARSASTLPTRCPTPEQVSQDCQYSTADLEAIPLKQESAFVSPPYFLANALSHRFVGGFSQNFGGFSFDDVASPVPTFDCDPMSSFAQTDSYSDSHFNPGLTIDTSFNDAWPSSPSPQSPEYVMSPMSTASPMSPYPTNFDGFDNFFETQFSPYNQTCGLSQQDTMQCGGGADNAQYGPFSDSPFDGTQLSHIDLAFTAFMTAIPQYS